MLKGKTFTQLVESERIKIEVLLQGGFSLTEIARQLARPVSTISREIKRNGSRKYKAARAQYISHQRHRHKPKSVVFDQSMKDYIRHQLKDRKWSPEIISVEGRKHRSDFISHEWIYRWIWQMKFSLRKAHQPYQLLYKHLKHSHRRKKRGLQRMKRGNIINRQWIDKRPKLADKRSQFGHLEADIVLGKGRKPGLLVAIDRKSRKTWITKLLSKKASYVMAKLKRICTSIGHVKTVTLDNDQGFAQHYQLNKMQIDTFFTHPYSSQEKGSVENRIGIIRMFFPKKTDFSVVSEREIKTVEKLINQRPMRMFNYKTPNEIHIS
jgi:transposase, IS30 family